MSNSATYRFWVGEGRMRQEDMWLELDLLEIKQEYLLVYF